MYLNPIQSLHPYYYSKISCSSFDQVVTLWGGESVGNGILGGNSNIFGIFTPDPWGFMIQFDEHMFQMGWFNHQLPLDPKTMQK